MALPATMTPVDYITSIACSATRMAISGPTGGVFVWEQEPSGVPAWSAPVRREWFEPFPFLAFSPDGSQLFCTHNCIHPPNWQRPLRSMVLDASSGNVVNYPRDSGPRFARYPPNQAAFSPDGSRLALCFRARDAAVHTFPSGERVLSLHHGSKAHMAAYSPDGKTLATASPDGLMRVWDAETGRQRERFKGQAKPLHAIAYSPDGRTIAAACGRGTVTLWDVQTGRARVALDWGIGEVHSVAFAPDGMRAAAGGMGVVALWDIDDWGA
jgi:WD40 repeat protein